MDQELARTQPLTYARSFAALEKSLRNAHILCFSDEELAVHIKALIDAYAEVGELVGFSGSMMTRVDGLCELYLGAATPFTHGEPARALPRELLNAFAVEQERARKIVEHAIAATATRELPEVSINADFRDSSREGITAVASFFAAKPVEIRFRSTEPYSERGEPATGGIRIEALLRRPHARITSTLETWTTDESDHARTLAIETKRWREVATSLGVELG